MAECVQCSPTYLMIASSNHTVFIFNKFFYLKRRYEMKICKNFSESNLNIKDKSHKNCIYQIFYNTTFDWFRLLNFFSVLLLLLIFLQINYFKNFDCDITYIQFWEKKTLKNENIFFPKLVFLWKLKYCII